MPAPLPACAPPQPAGHGKTRARSPPRSAPPPWPDRAGRAAPSARRAGLPGLLAPATEPRRRSAALRPRSPPPAPPWSSPRRTAECRQCARRCPAGYFAGSCLFPTRRSMMASMSRSPSRLRVSARHMRLSNPRRLEFRPERHDQQHAEEFVIRSTVRPNSSRLVGSVQCASSKIISTGLLPGQRFQLRAECFQRFLPALLRRQFERGIASVVRQRQHLGKERGILSGGRGLRQHRIELVELRLRRVVVRQVRRRVPSGR